MKAGDGEAEVLLSSGCLLSFIFQVAWKWEADWHQDTVFIFPHGFRGLLAMSLQ